MARTIFPAIPPGCTTAWVGDLVFSIPSIGVLVGRSSKPATAGSGAAFAADADEFASAAAAFSEPGPAGCVCCEAAKRVVGAEGGGSGQPPMTIMPNSTSLEGGPSEMTSATVFLDGGMGFLLERIFILSIATTEEPPRWVCTWVLRSDINVDGATSVNVSVIAGLRADLRVKVMGCCAVSEPGAGAGTGPVLGGGGCGGEDSFGRV